MSTSIFLAVLQSALALTPAAPAQQPSKHPSFNGQKPPQLVTVRKFRRLYWSPVTRRISSQGAMEVDAQPMGPGKTVVVTGENIDFDTVERIVHVYGAAHVARERDVIEGRTANYDLDAGTGDFQLGSVVTEYFRMRGKRIQLLPDGRYLLINGIFTTCDRRRPDYVVRARRLTISPKQYLFARQVTFYAANKPLVTLPFLRENLQQSNVVPMPVPSYSATQGPAVRLYSMPIVRPHETLDYDLHIGVRTLPFGFVAYQRDLAATQTSSLPPKSLLQTINSPLRGFLEQLAPPTYQDYSASGYEDTRGSRTTFYAITTNQQGVFNRRRDDLLVTATPELGIQFQNVLAPRSSRSAPVQQPNDNQPTGSTEAAIRRISNAPMLLNFTASGGYFLESPTQVSSGRLATRINLATQPIALGKRASWRAGVSNRLNFYSRGSVYDLLMPETELDYVPTKTSLYGIAYRYLTDTGTTPFLFDRRDLRHEVRLRYQVGGPWGFGVIQRYDMETLRAYDTEIAVVRNLDCMQLGLAYRSLDQSINIIFNLLPSRHRRVSDPAWDVPGESPFSGFPDTH